MADKSDRKDDKETGLRRDVGITRMLNTPPKPHKDMKKGKAKAGKKPSEEHRS